MNTTPNLPLTAEREHPEHAAGRRRGRHLVARVAAATALLAGLGLAAAGPAHAYQYSAAGYIGAAGVNTVSCRYLNAWGVVRAEIPTPVAYASNRTAGWGNDSQYVRYRLYAVDVRTGQNVAVSGYSGYSLARDNVLATWSGTDMLSVDWRSVYRIETRFEFFNARTGAYEGWSAHRADRYLGYNGYTTYPIGPNLDSCAKV